MKILLCFLPQCSINFPLVGLAYIAANLKKHHYDVRQRDFNHELFLHLPEKDKRIVSDLGNACWDNDEKYAEIVRPLITPHLNRWAGELAASDFDIIGFSLFWTNRIPTLDLINSIKAINPGKTIIVGGPTVTEVEPDYLSRLLERNAIDVFVKGEGEEVIVELLDAIERKQDFNRIPGIFYKTSGVPVFTGERPQIEDLDTLPFPDYSDYSLHEYPGFQMPIVGSRGCIHRCSFCSEHTLSPKYRGRSGKHIVEELMYFQKLYNVNNYYFVDPLINGNISELERMCDLIIDEGLNVEWGGKISFRKEMTFPLLMKMRKAGCCHLEYGAESGSAAVLERMRKKFDLNLAAEIIKNTYQAGIIVALFWIVGFPTETEEHFDEGLQFLLKNRHHVHNIMTSHLGCMIIPNTDLAVNPRNYSIVAVKSHIDWTSECLDTASRLRRVERFIDFCRVHQIPLDVS